MSDLPLRRHAGADAVTASSVSGLVGTLIPSPRGVERTEVQAVFYAGAFAGTGSVETVTGVWPMVFVSLFGAAVFLLIKPRFRGVGGLLGTSAFLASLPVVAVEALARRVQARRRLKTGCEK